MDFITLFFLFCRTVIFSFGGGYATVSLLQNEILSNEFLTSAEFTNIVAMSQILPGSIVVNMAVFIGFSSSGILGALVTTLGVVLPSFILILFIFKFAMKYNNLKIYGYIIKGLSPAVVGLIFVAFINIAIPELFYNIYTPNYKSIAISVLAFISIYKFKVNLVGIILISSIIGILIFD